MEKLEIAMRIRVLDPPADVTMMVQKGRDELLPAAKVNKKVLIFDLSLTVDISTGTPNFLGKFAQGPRGARFLYLNSGTYAGQRDTCWSRRAKIPLTGITAEDIGELVRSPGSRMEISFPATGGRDGGPVCGTIRSVADQWKITNE